MSYHVYLSCPGNVADITATKRVFAQVVALFDTLAGYPCQGEIIGGDDLGPNATLHIRPGQHHFHLRAEDVRASGPSH